MIDRTERSGLSRAGWVAFCLGLGLIGLSTVLNVIHDRLDGGLPYLQDAYATAGKSGVTMLLVGTGLVIVLFAVTLGHSRQPPARPEDDAEQVLTRLLGLGSASSGSSAQAAVQLQTRKYLTPPKGSAPLPPLIPPPVARDLQPGMAMSGVAPPDNHTGSEWEPDPDDFPDADDLPEAEPLTDDRL